MKTPDSLTFNTYGSGVARQHDLMLCGESGLNVLLKEKLVVDEKQYYLRLYDLRAKVLAAVGIP